MLLRDQQSQAALGEEHWPLRLVLETTWWWSCVEDYCGELRVRLNCHGPVALLSSSHTYHRVG
jgi:hypothetical protein